MNRRLVSGLALALLLSIGMGLAVRAWIAPRLQEAIEDVRDEERERARADRAQRDAAVSTLLEDLTRARRLEIEAEGDAWPAKALAERSRVEAERARQAVELAMADLVPATIDEPPPVDAPPITALIAIVAFAACVVGAAWVRATTVRRDREAAETLERVMQGEEVRLVEPPRGDPRHVLAAAFNRTIDALLGARRELQQRVDEKTRALGLALEESHALNERLQRVLRELETTQVRLVQQEKMAALGTLSGGVAHEFNNILGGIRGCVDDLALDLNDPDDLETLGVVRRAAERGRRIVEGLRQFSRGESGRPETVALRGLVDDLRRLVQGEAREREVQLEVAIEPELEFALHRVAVEQVLTNLALNAIQAAGAGGRVVVRAERTSSGLDLIVEDDGPGVPDELRPRLFEPFFTTREKDGGTGLGLAVSHGLIDALGGSIVYEPRTAGGARFRVRLPDAHGEGSKDA